jgi:hypothetical protein
MAWQEPAALRDFYLAYVGLGSMLLKKSLMRSVEPSDQPLRAFCRPRSSSSCLAGLASLARASNAPCMLDATDA